MRTINNKVDTHIEMLYTEGDCWYFAFRLHRELNRRGIKNTLCMVGHPGDTPKGFWWHHMFVRIGSHAVDVTGLRTVEDMSNSWNGETRDFKARSVKWMNKNLWTQMVFPDSKDMVKPTIDSLLSLLEKDLTELCHV